MSTTRTARIAASVPIAASLPDAREPANGDSTGWDPYEVWRTRVLLPRLQELAVAEQPAESPKKP